MYNAAYHAPIIDPVSSFAASRQQGLDPPPLRFAQPVNLLCHPSLQITLENLNHKSASA
jgi:hypothetical protein